MRNILLFALMVLSTLMWSCEDMYEKHAKYEGEIVYPAKFDTIIGAVGFERVELDLLKAGRISSDEIQLGKASKTRIEYGDTALVIDSLVSFVNVTNLTESKLYRFKAYTLDQYGNKSVPQEIALIPFTTNDFNNLAVIRPRIMASLSSAVIDWPSGISSVLMDYYSLKYEYTDKDGKSHSGEREEDTRIFIGNMEAGQPVEVNMEYEIRPLINGNPILDTVIFEDQLVINMPTSATQFEPAEGDILTANGAEAFTIDGISSIEDLVYPVHANSLQDVFYFPNLKTVDLTGGDLFSLPELSYDGDTIETIVGGGEIEPYLRKAGDVPYENTQALRDLLESDLLDKVNYRPNSMGLDALLQPYVASGVVEMVEGPASVMVDNSFQLDGIYEDLSWQADVTYPATDAPAGAGIENPYKVEVKATKGSLVFAFPKEYQINAEEYRYLKMKVYAPELAAFEGEYEPFKCILPKFMNSLSSYVGNSDFGRESWESDQICIDDAELETWVDVTIDLSEAAGLHNRVMVLNIGGDADVAFEEGKEMIFYFSNIRFEKQ
jgi:hypothetical protein